MTPPSLLLLIAALLLPPLGACAQAQPDVAIAQPGVMKANSPPPIIAVPSSPSAPVRILHPTPPTAAPAPPAARIVRAPQERRPAQAYISAADYPASALANREAGRVRVTLDLGPDGRAHGCAVTRSGGSSALDSATCSILRRRARFTPAIDSNGQPAAGRIRQEVDWRLPE